MRLVPLRIGSRGSEVSQLQELLNRRLTLLPAQRLRVDGEFGPRTAEAVKLFQARYGLGIDGVVGTRTWTALNSGAAAVPQPRMSPSPVVSSDAPWMPIATREIGQVEIEGRRHNPRIVEYHASTSMGAAADETAWCSSFVNWVLRQAGIRGTNSAAAASWTSWGQSCHARTGAVTVIFNPSAANSRLSRSGNHVGFLAEDNGGHFVLLGGNQSDSVRISRFPKSTWQLRGYRWPRQ